jgi:hypothetical protein
MAELPVFERQSDEPLYPKVLWNRPVSRLGAGRLLLLGGHSGEFSLVTGVHQVIEASGVGECVAALPDSLVRILGGAPNTAFVASSPSGSLGREALARLIELGEDADAVLIGANLSNNSLTTILIERFMAESERPIIAFAAALVSLQHNLKGLTERPGNLLIVTMPEIFKLATALGVAITIRRDGGVLNKLEIIRDVAAASKCDYVVYGSEIIVSVDGKLGLSTVNYRLGQLPAMYFGTLSVFWTQNPKRRFEGLMTGSYVLGQVSERVFSDPKRRPSLTDGTMAVREFLKDSS